MLTQGKSVAETKVEKPIPENKKVRKKSNKQRSQSLLFAADSAIDRLRNLSEPGGGIEDMDIKDLKNLISSIRELSTISAELSGEERGSGVVVLPEVKLDE